MKHEMKTKAQCFLNFWQCSTGNPQVWMGLQRFHSGCRCGNEPLWSLLGPFHLFWTSESQRSLVWRFDSRWRWGWWGTRRSHVGPWELEVWGIPGSQRNLALALALASAQMAERVSITLVSMTLHWISIKSPARWGPEFAFLSSWIYRSWVRDTCWETTGETHALELDV